MNFIYFKIHQNQNGSTFNETRNNLTSNAHRLVNVYCWSQLSSQRFMRMLGLGAEKLFTFLDINTDLT